MKPLRALVVEHDRDDVELVTLELERAGYAPVVRQVATLDDLRATLADPWDIIYSDFQLEGFTALDVLEVVRGERHVDLPFIVVSGSIGEDVAVSAMRAGADDYFRKEHLERLGAATARSLRDAETRRQGAEGRRREIELRRDAESANKMKDEFLLVLSHELRTPLNAILGWATLLAEGAVPLEKRARAVEAIVRAARQQARLIDELLDIARITTGKLELAYHALDLAKIVEAAIDVVRPMAGARAVRLDVQLDDRCSTSGDAERLQQVVWNLLSNAIKFTPPGGAVSVRLAREAGSAVFVVSDDGAGISAEFLPHVFERFRQADASITRRYGGLGIGLTIAKGIVEAHGGEISAASDGPGRGATFTVRLPIRAASAVARGEESVTGRAELRDVRVLVVEDDPEAREMLADTLRAYGGVVRTAESAHEALDAYEEWPPDVLVSDIGLPDEDGYALLRAIRSRHAADGPLVPAAALTAYASAADARRAMDAGYRVHVAKPIEAAKLVRVVRDLADSPKPEDARSSAI
jgi:signal transduction histidine kinase